MCRCMASFGRPVDPDVHSQNPGDSSHVAHGSPPSAPPDWSASHSEEPVTITVDTSGAAARMLSSSVARSADTTSTRGAAGGDGRPDVPSGQHRIDRCRHGADAEGAEEDVVELDRVEHHHRHALFGGDAEAAQSGRRGGDLVEQLGVGDGALAGDDRRVVAAARLDVAVEQVDARVVLRSLRSPATPHTARAVAGRSLAGARSLASEHNFHGSDPHVLEVDRLWRGSRSTAEPPSRRSCRARSRRPSATRRTPGRRRWAATTPRWPPTPPPTRVVHPGSLAARRTCRRGD